MKYDLVKIGASQGFQISAMLLESWVILMALNRI